MGRHRVDATVSLPRTPAMRGKGRKVFLLGYPSGLANEFRLKGASVEEIQAEDALDDASWATILARVKSRDFGAVFLQLATDTYGGGLRTTERPHGAKELRPEDKEQVRAANKLAHRGLQAAAAATPRRLA